MIREFAVQLTADGMIPIPEKLRRELELKPQQTLYIRTDSERGQIVIDLVTRREIADRIVALMRMAFEGVSLADLKAERADDANRR